MRIQKINLKNFKRFTDLTIDLSGKTKVPKLVLLVGPNGSGKSSLLDAFEQIGGKGKSGFRSDGDYLRKDQSKDFEITLCTDQGEKINKTQAVAKKSFYIRSAYRFDNEFSKNSLSKKDDILEDSARPKRLIDLDKRTGDNYERLVTSTIKQVYNVKNDDKRIKEVREEIIGKVQEVLKRIFSKPQLYLESPGDPLEEGTFFFKKGEVSNFSFKNLSAGERNVFDIVLDLVLKSSSYNETVYAIDEPEIHMSTTVQGLLLQEMHELIPENSQLWLCTHSIGFVRKAVDLIRNGNKDIALVNFSNADFDSSVSLTPSGLEVESLREIFSVAIDDLAELLTPAKLIFCEGSIKENTDPDKKELDAKIYNTIFSEQDVLFISSDNKRLARESAELLITALKKSGSVREVFALLDKDELNDEDIKTYKKQKPYQKFLKRREIENYLFDPEIVRKYCESNSIAYPKTIMDGVRDVSTEKFKQIQGPIKNALTDNKTRLEDFKVELATFITPDTVVYQKLKETLD